EPLATRPSMSVSWERVPTGWSTSRPVPCSWQSDKAHSGSRPAFNLAKGELISYTNVSSDCGRQRAWRHGTLLVHWVCRADVGGDFSLGHAVGEYHRLSQSSAFSPP